MIIEPDIIKAFKTISLEEMGKVRLMNRIDTKYVTTLNNITVLLKTLATNQYYIQEIGGHSNMPYYTKYFDTRDTHMFYQHQRGKRTRQKVRVRKYEGSDTPPFIEVKTKNNKGRTKKNRVAMDGSADLTHYGDFFNTFSQYRPEELLPQIENHFFRITLVNKEMTERITIDTNLEFHNLITLRDAKFENIGIIEWKRDGLKDSSRLGIILRDMRIRPTGFSKYCVGMAVTNPSLRQNRMKRKLRRIDRINSSIQQQ